MSTRNVKLMAKIAPIEKNSIGQASVDELNFVHKRRGPKLFCSGPLFIRGNYSLVNDCLEYLESQLHANLAQQSIVSELIHFPRVAESSSQVGDKISFWINRIWIDVK